MSANRLRIFAGPNGSGKSTLFEAISDISDQLKKQKNGYVKS